VRARLRRGRGTRLLSHDNREGGRRGGGGNYRHDFSLRILLVLHYGVAVAYSIAGNPHRARLPTAVAGHTFEAQAAHNIWGGAQTRDLFVKNSGQGLELWISLFGAQLISWIGALDSRIAPIEVI